MAASKAETLVLTFPLDLGMDGTAQETAVQPVGDRPALVSSTNTRLSRVRGVPTKAPGAVAMTDAASPHSGSSACGGIIPCGHISSSLVLRQKLYGPQRIAGTQLQALAAPLSGGVQSFWPADVSRAGAVPARGQYRDPALCLVDGQMWFASIRTNGTALSIFVSVIGEENELLAAPQAVYTLASGAISSPPWVGLTEHGANGVRLWFRDGSSARVGIVALTLANGVVTAGTPTTIYTPAGAGDQSYDLAKQDDDTAWLVTLSSAVTTSIALHKVTIATHAISTTTSAVASTTGSMLAVHCQSMTAGVRVAVAVSLVGSNDNTFMMFDGSGGALWSVTGQLTYGETAVGFYKHGATEYAVFGVADISGTTGSLSSFPNSATFQFRNVVGGGLVATKVLPWTRFVSRFAHHSPSATELYPVFVGQGCWDDATQRFATNANYLTDPAIDVYRVDSTTQVSRIGRFGVDRAHVYSISGLSGAAYNGQTICVDGDKLALVYAEATGIYPDTDVPLRYVEMDFASRQPRHAIGADGVAIVAGALPVEWDGVTLSEICAPLRTRVFVSSTGGSGTPPIAGTYQISACIVWPDAAGVKHRGPPSRAVSVTMGGVDAWVIDVALPYVFRNGLSQDQYEIELYATDTNGSVLYRIVAGTPTTTSYAATFSGTSKASPNATTPTLYTIAELEAQQPGAFADVAIVTNRGWALNAERRYEWFYTKPKDTGTGFTSIAYEWSSSLKVSTPPAAGDGVAVVESDGNTVLLCENGIWVVTGEGPDAGLTSGAFNSPEQVSDLGCSDRGSVIKTPMGVMFISNGRFARFGGGAQQLYEQIDASSLGSTFPVLLRDAQEVVWFSSSGVHYVYNYSLDRWTVWDSTVCPAIVACSLDPVSGLINVVRASDGAVMQIDPATASSAAQMAFTTGRVEFGGPQDDNVVHDVLIHARRAGSHGLTVTLTQDHGATAYVRTWTAAEVLSATKDGQYTLCLSPGSMSMRALKVAIQETGATGDAFRPSSLSITFTKNPGTMRDAVLPAGRK
jgi:hypothetical protein